MGINICIGFILFIFVALFWVNGFNFYMPGDPDSYLLIFTYIIAYCVCGLGLLFLFALATRRPRLATLSHLLMALTVAAVLIAVPIAFSCDILEYRSNALRVGASYELSGHEIFVTLLPIILAEIVFPIYGLGIFICYAILKTVRKSTHCASTVLMIFSAVLYFQLTAEVLCTPGNTG